MTRRRVHLLFGATAVGLGLFAAYQGWRLENAERVNAAIASASVAELGGSLPQARFARAVALCKAGKCEDAAKSYKQLIQEDRTDLKRAALFNLGNLRLRDALKNGAEDVVNSLPLVELAKQNYRDLLRDDPMDWDARYNLERALWLAPELDEPEGEGGSNIPEFERRVAPRAQGFSVELP
jgi:mxaK protein